MANIISITTTSTNPTAGMTVRTNADVFTFMGNFTYYLIGDILHITGSASILKFDLATDTATINGTPMLGADDTINALNTAFIK